MSSIHQACSVCPATPIIGWYPLKADESNVQPSLHLPLSLPLSPALISSQRVRYLHSWHVAVRLRARWNPFQPSYYRQKVPPSPEWLVTWSTLLFPPGTFPFAFNVNEVTSPLKKSFFNPTQMGNFRLVSFLPLLSKTIERAVLKHFIETLSPPWPELIRFQEWPFLRNSPVVFVIETPKTARSSCSGFGFSFCWSSVAFDKLTSTFSFHSLCLEHNLHLTYLGVQSGCCGNVSPQLLGCQLLQPLPYSQPRWDQSSACLFFHTTAVWMTPSHTCPFLRISPHSQTRS